MKTFLQWRESFSATNVMQTAKGDKENYGVRAAEGFQDVVDALRTLASENPQSYNFIIAKIRSEAQKVNPSLGSSVGVAGRRYGSAVASANAKNSSQMEVDS